MHNWYLDTKLTLQIFLTTVKKIRVYYKCVLPVGVCVCVQSNIFTLPSPQYVFVCVCGQSLINKQKK
jgi:hypothetical protein